MTTFKEKYTDPSYIESADRRKIVSLKDKGEARKYMGFNPKGLHLSVYRIDGGIIKSATAGKCDFAIYTESDVLYVIELKGQDYLHALEQLISTITLLITKDLLPPVINARIVLSKVRVPNTLTTQQKKLMHLVKQYGGDFQKASREMQEDLK